MFPTINYLFMSEKPKIITDLVSIAIPAYKARYLHEAIDSALRQDYTNIEVVIVNDKSPYDLDSIVSQFNDERIRYYKNHINLGSQSIVLNWNRCLEYAKGEYFVLLCDDDYLFPNFVSTLLSLVKKYPSCDVFHARRMIIHKDQRNSESKLWPEFESGEDFQFNSLENKRHHTVKEFLFRTEFIKSKGGYMVFPSGYYSDTASILSWSKNGIASSQECICAFRHNEENISSNNERSHSYQKFNAAFQYWHWILNFPNATKHLPKIKEDIESTIYLAFISAGVWNSIKIIAKTPNSLISIKHKIGFILSYLSTNKHT